MGGSSGGGNTQKKTDEPSAKVTTTTSPAFMPGFDSMIAQQLGMGGYGDPNTLLAAMQAIQTPLQIPGIVQSTADTATNPRRGPKGNGPVHRPRTPQAMNGISMMDPRAYKG